MTVPQAMEHLLAETLLTVHIDWLVTEVSTHDQSRANQVILGKPTSELRSPIVVSIHTQHPLGPPEDVDKNISGGPRTQAERPWRFPAESTGGASVEAIYGATQVRIRENMQHIEALKIKSVVVKRIRQAINKDTRLRTLEDDFGDTMFWIETFEHPGYAAGGGDVSIFIEWVSWRAFVCSSTARDVTL